MVLSPPVEKELVRERPAASAASPNFRDRRVALRRRFFVTLARSYLHLITFPQSLLRRRRETRPFLPLSARLPIALIAIIVHARATATIRESRHKHWEVCQVVHEYII